MIQHPTFKSHLHIERLDEEGLMLLSERGQVVLRGRLYGIVAPLIDGRRSADDITEELKGQLSAAEVHYVLKQLEKKHYLTAGNGSVRAAGQAYWHLQNIDPALAHQRLKQTTLSITVLGGIPCEPLQAALRSLGVRIGGRAQVGVVVTDDYLRSGLEEYNHESLRERRTWLLVKPVGSQIWVGPVFRPWETACWECLAVRLRANRQTEVFLQQKTGRVDPLPLPIADLPTTRALAWNLAATEIAKWIARGDLIGEKGRPDGRPSAEASLSRAEQGLAGNLVTVDTLIWKMQRHTIVRQPQCRACGDPNATRDSAIVLQSRNKTFTRDGGHRSIAPEETLRRYEHHVSRLTGAVTSLERFQCSASGVVHVYGAGHNAAWRQKSLEDIRRGLRSQSAGKGASDSQARASALCEALERHSGIFRGDEPRTKPCRLRDLGQAAIHPNLCMQYSDRQYRERAPSEEDNCGPSSVPERFDESEAVEWTPIWSLTRKQVCYLPTAFCYYGYPMKRRYCRACSNGNAAGNTLEEAILQGFFELVERDAVALWWYNRVRRPGVNLDSFHEPYLIQLAQCLREQQHRDLWALDLTSDLPIPAFAALSRRVDRTPEEILIGFGAHSDARIALLRAMTELNQMLAWLWIDKDGKPVLQEKLDDPHTIEWLSTATLQNQPHLSANEGPQRAFADFPECTTDDIRDDVLASQRLVERHGLEMLVLDQTRPDIGLPVVKVIVPGLRHFWPRFAPGRLYDTPVKLGWQPKPLREEELNPIPIFL